MSTGVTENPCFWMQLTKVCLTGRRTNEHSVKTYGLWPIMSPELGSFHPASKVIHRFVAVGWHHSSPRKGPGPCVLSWFHSLINPTSIQFTQNLKGYHKLLYFEWPPPWHLSICYWQIFWHSIWHIFWHSIPHSIWHIFWHIFWYIFWHISWNFIWHIFWHSIWHSIWHIFWHSICPLRSSSAHWAGEVPGWGAAVHTALGKSQVEVQRCTLGWAGPRLRSSGAHWAETVPGWGPAVHTELEVQRCALSWAGPRLRSQCTLSWEVGKELGEESWQRAGEELARRKWRWKLMQTWSRRN